MVQRIFRQAQDWGALNQRWLRLQSDLISIIITPMIQFKFKSLQSALFVSIQFVCIIALGFIGNIVPENLVLLILEILFILLGLWAILVMRFNVNVSPDIIENSNLITFGPYKFIRHPMYAAVIFTTFIWLLAKPSVVGLIVWVVLLVNLFFKMLYEERQLAQRFSEYNEYKNKTKRLIPFIF
jgi:protein-S-isoprenylcysteine O-methyltransferase Ste14